MDQEIRSGPGKEPEDLRTTWSPPEATWSRLACSSMRFSAVFRHICTGLGNVLRSCEIFGDDFAVCWHFDIRSPERSKFDQFDKFNTSVHLCSLHTDSSEVPAACDIGNVKDLTLGLPTEVYKRWQRFSSRMASPWASNLLFYWSPFLKLQEWWAACFGFPWCLA